MAGLKWPPLQGYFVFFGAKELPMAGIEPASPRPQRGVLTTILHGPIVEAQKDGQEPEGMR